jgi:hypothetical protein
MCFSPETIAAVRTVMDRRYRAITSADGDAAIRDYRALVDASKGPSLAALRAVFRLRQRGLRLPSDFYARDPLR